MPWDPRYLHLALPIINQVLDKVTKPGRPVTALPKMNWNVYVDQELDMRAKVHVRAGTSHLLQVIQGLSLGLHLRLYGAEGVSAEGLPRQENV